MKNTCSFCIVFQVLKVSLIKICKIQPPDLLFLVVFISFYIISRYHFHKFLELDLTLSEKKIFVTNFAFLKDSRFTYCFPSCFGCFPCFPWCFSLCPILGLTVFRTYFCKKVRSEMFGWVLNTPLIFKFVRGKLSKSLFHVKINS